MSDVARTPAPQEFDLRPEDLVVEKQYARLWLGDEEQEALRIERLAALINKVGQLYPVLATANASGSKYTIVDGHRRTRAIILANQRRTEQSQELLKVRVRLVTGGDLIQKAIVSNIARESYGPMELALRASHLREDKKFGTGFKQTKRIADYLGVDPTTITQYEKFLAVSGDTQNLLGEGVISAQTVLDMLKADVSEEEQPALLKRAKEIQEETDKALTKRSKKRREEQAAKTGKSSKRIEAPAVKKAIREAKGDSGAKIALTRRELLDSLQVFDSPLYGYPDGQVRQFVTYFVDKFAVGEGSVSQMRKRFTAMVSKAAKGTKQAEPAPVAKKTVKKATKKAAPKSTPKPAATKPVAKVKKTKAAKRKK